MRILLVIDGMHPRHGGPPAIVAGSAIALRELGHDVEVLTLYRQGDKSVVSKTWQSMLDKGVQIEFCEEEGLVGLFGYPRQRSRFTNLVAKFDVIHIHGVWSGMFIVLARICRKLGKPYFVSSHGVFDHRAMKRLKRKYFKKRLAIELFDIRGYLDHASGVVFGSQAEADESWFPSRNLRVVVVPNGVSSSAGTAEPSAEQLKRLHAVAPAQASWKRTILCRSRIHEEKGHDMLVAAFDSLAHDFPDVGLLIAGLKQVDAYEERVRGMIASSQHCARMVLTTDLVGPENQFVSRVCSIYVTPSIAEGFSMSLVEGLANGRPMLITRFCHMPVVEESGAGVIVDPTTQSIAQGLRELLLLETAQLQSMGRKARLLFESRYTWERVGHSLVEVYQAAIQSVPST